MTPERLELIARNYRLGFGKPDPMPEIIAAFEHQAAEVAHLRKTLEWVLDYSNDPGVRAEVRRSLLPPCPTPLP